MNTFLHKACYVVVCMLVACVPASVIASDWSTVGQQGKTKLALDVESLELDVLAGVGKVWTRTQFNPPSKWGQKGGEVDGPLRGRLRYAEICGASQHCIRWRREGGWFIGRSATDGIHGAGHYCCCGRRFTLCGPFGAEGSEPVRPLNNGKFGDTAGTGKR